MSLVPPQKRPPAVPAASVTVRRSNLALVLRHLRDRGPRSRARIAQETGLNKATVSSLVADLARRGLVVDTGRDLERDGAVGRPGRAVAVGGQAVAGIGIELNVDYVAVMALDLRCDVLVDERRPLDVRATGPERTLDLVASLAADAIRAVEARGAAPVGITLAVPALVETAPGVVGFAPNLGWRSLPVVDALRERLGAPSYPIAVDNDANLSALAEAAMGAAAGTPDLVYLTGEVGVGSGVIVAGELLCGADGFSGEVGHMPLGEAGRTCGCGRQGCWETAVGLAALLRKAADADDPVHDRGMDLEARLVEIRRRADSGDARVLAALHEVGASLGVGASVLVNLVNPAVLVLGGYFAAVGDHLREPLLRELHDRVIAPDLGGCRVELSSLGFTAAARGGAWVALEAVLTDPTVVHPPAADPPSVRRERIGASAAGA